MTKKEFIRLTPRTQKAKGILQLAENGPGLFFSSKISPLTFHLIQSPEDVYTLAAKKPKFPLFARPCPPKPCHGFVDSRPVHSFEEIKKVLEEAQAVEPLAEVVLMPFINADWNAIWTPGSLTVGPGNDGATSGKDAIKIGTTSTLPCKPSIISASGVNSPDVPYFEFVGNHESKHVVQLRGGPNIADIGDDFLPFELTVKNIVEPQGEDLLAWQERVGKFAPGTAVWHKGGAMSSHYGVHCKLKKVAYFTARKPKVGETLIICKCKTKIADEWCPDCGGFRGRFPVADVEETIRGFEIGVGFDCSYEDAALIVLGAAHNFAAFGKKESRLLGIGLAFAVRLGTAACFGEARHKVQRDLVRHQVYEVAWRDFETMIRRLNEARALFYGVSWSSQIGGPAWGKCADSAANLWNGIVKMIRSRDEKSLNEAVSLLHVLLNQAHNNGWWFNKFVSKNWFDISAKCAAAPLMAVAPLVYRLMKAPLERFDLVAKIERMEETTVAKKNPEKRDYKGFTITYNEAAKEPWAIVGADGNAVKKFTNLRDVAYFLNESLGKPTEKRFVTATYAVLSRAVRETTNGDAWIIPDLTKADLDAARKRVGEGNYGQVDYKPKKKKAAPKFVEPLMSKVVKAQCKLTDNVIHIQYKTENSPSGHYFKHDLVATPLMMKEWASAPQVASWAGGSDTVYKECNVALDGIYIGLCKIMVLSDGKI